MPDLQEEEKLETGVPDYGHFVNRHSARRRPAVTRELTKLHYLAPKGAISLAEGMPNEQMFPFAEITASLKDGTRLELGGRRLGAALQYIPSQGYPPLVAALKEFTQLAHAPPNWGNSDLLVTNGSQDGISKAVEMVLQEGDPVLVQNPLYAGVETVLKPFKAQLIPVAQDHLGMVPELLEEALERRKKSGLKMPKLLYVNPTASNPTGTTIPLVRRRRIYAISCQHNLLILEDDPYHFMHFLDAPTPSFLSLDTEGRVLRFDSLSKILSAGLRVGWATGPQPLISRLELHVQSAHLHSSTLSQVLVHELLTSWGFGRLLAHLESVRSFYEKRRDVALEAMERHLAGRCDWQVPTGGMFVWMRVRHLADVYEMLVKRGSRKGVSFVPGHPFMADPAQKCAFVRASYSRASEAQLDTAMRLLAELIDEELELQRVKAS